MFLVMNNELLQVCFSFLSEPPEVSLRETRNLFAPAFHVDLIFHVANLL
jgi:hypothetical protein